MKTMATIFAMLFAVFFTVVAPDAEAKRFASGKSFGKSYRTEPYNSPSPAMNAAKPAQPGAAAAAGSPARGMMGGLLGGLLAGGLIAALFGGAFSGLQIMDFLIIGLVAFLIFRFLKARQQAARPAYAGPSSYGASYGNAQNQANAQYRGTHTNAGYGAGSQGGSAHDHGHSGDASQCPFMAAGRESADTASSAAATPASAEQGMGEGSVPFSFPPDFRINAFLEGAREHYRTLQDAWNKNDFTKIREYVAADIVAALEAERAELDGEQHTDVLFVDAEVVRADVQGDTAELSLRFRGAYRDLTEGTGETDFIDIWHLERDFTTAGAPWMIVGIESR